MYTNGHDSKPTVPFWDRYTTHFSLFQWGLGCSLGVRGFDPQPNLVCVKNGGPKGGTLEQSLGSGSKALGRQRLTRFSWGQAQDGDVENAVPCLVDNKDFARGQDGRTIHARSGLFQNEDNLKLRDGGIFDSIESGAEPLNIGLGVRPKVRPCRSVEGAGLA